MTGGWQNYKYSTDPEVLITGNLWTCEHLWTCHGELNCTSRGPKPQRSVFARVTCWCQCCRDHPWHESWHRDSHSTVTVTDHLVLLNSIIIVLSLSIGYSVSQSPQAALSLVYPDCNNIFTHLNHLVIFRVPRYPQFTRPARQPRCVKCWRQGHLVSVA